MVVAVVAFNCLGLSAIRDPFTRAAQNPFSPSGMFILVIVVNVPLYACWIFKHRTDAIVARLHRSLPITTCRNCLYDAAGLPTDRCPECGQKFPTIPPRATP